MYVAHVGDSGVVLGIQDDPKDDFIRAEARVRFLGDSFICKFCASLEGHSFQGLHPTSQTEDKSAVPSMEQVIQGNNKCERQQHSLRGLN